MAFELLCKVVSVIYVQNAEAGNMPCLSWARKWPWFEYRSMLHVEISMGSMGCFSHGQVYVNYRARRDEIGASMTPEMATGDAWDVKTAAVPLLGGRLKDGRQRVPPTGSNNTVPRTWAGSEDDIFHPDISSVVSQTYRRHHHSTNISIYFNKLSKLRILHTAHMELQCVDRECMRMQLPAKISDIYFRGCNSFLYALWQENPVDASMNEHYLWHGCKPEGAEGITDANFDLKRTSAPTCKGP